MDYPNLFRPLHIGACRIENRLVQAATAEVYSIADGLTNRRNLAFLEARAKGGVGLIITGNRLVHPHSMAPCRGYVAGYDRNNLERERTLVTAVQRHGTRIFAQFNHFGAQANSMCGDDYRHLVSSSAMRSPAWGETPKPMGATDMDAVANYWGECAALAREAGYDGTEIHMANGYLLHQFISEIYNHRQDDYGGSLNNRLRFPMQVLARVRERVGKDFVVGIRLCAEEMVPGGADAATAADIANHFAATDQIDYVGLAGGTYHSYSYEVPPEDIGEAWLMKSAGSIREKLDGVPVIAAGGLVRPETAEKALAAGQVDAVAISRALLADPDFAVKARNGLAENINHCIRCNQGCIARLFKAAPIACTVNPAAGREQIFPPLSVIEQPEYWIVVGGGPAGMRAAAGLAERGHRVRLYERQEELGGQVRLILEQPGRQSFAALINDLASRLRRSGAELRLPETITAEELIREQPDGVILATGSSACHDGFSVAQPFTPRLPGAEGKNVLTVPETLLNATPLGGRVLLLDGDGGRYALGTAQYLLDRGCEVHIVTRFPQLAPLTGQSLEQALLYADVFGRGLTYTVNAWVTRIEADAAHIVNLYTGKESIAEGFTGFVLATGQRAEGDDLYRALMRRHPNVHRIGDALAPRQLDQALYEAELAARELLDDPARYIPTGSLEAVP